MIPQTRIEVDRRRRELLGLAPKRRHLSCPNTVNPKQAGLEQNAEGMRSCRADLDVSIDARRIAMMLRTGLALFVLVGASLPGLGQEIKIVVPNELENVEGDVDATSGTTPYRTQQLSPASEFATLPETYRTIIGMYLRPDRTITRPRTAVADDYAYSAVYNVESRF